MLSLIADIVNVSIDIVISTHNQDVFNFSIRIKQNKKYHLSRRRSDPCESDQFIFIYKFNVMCVVHRWHTMIHRKSVQRTKPYLCRIEFSTNSQTRMRGSYLGR